MIRKQISQLPFIWHTLSGHARHMRVSPLGRPASLLAITLLALLLLAGCAGVGQFPDGTAIGPPGQFDGIEQPSLDDLPARRLGPRPDGSLKTVVEQYLQQYQPEGKLPRLFETTRLFDRNGVLLAEFFEEGRRTWVSLDEISPHLISATIATEDASFFTNRGVDTRRIVGAALQNAESQSIVSGASTITMQLARNLFLDPAARYEQSFDRKLYEIGLAHDLTVLFTKEELLEIYLNLANYGNLAYGPEAAAESYFGKSAADLTLAEATILAGVPQQPADYNLFTNFDAAKDRQRIVLDLMVRHGVLLQDEADTAFATEILLAEPPEPPEPLAPHFVFYVEQALEGRMARTLGVEDGRWEMRRSGMHIVTSLDMQMQRLAEQQVQDWIRQVGPRYEMSNGALVAIQPSRGEILAMAGGIDFNNEIDGQVNLAISPRQPGSAVKPILYATALDDDLISPATVIWDTPIIYTVGPGRTYEPQNYDERFHGPVTTRSALANSYNVPAVKLLASLGKERMLSKAREFGILSLSQDPREYGLSLSLGAGEMTLLELTNAFRTFANQGVYSPPQFALFMVDDLGRYRPPPATEQQQIISPGTAFQITDILSDNEARTPGFGAFSRLRLSRPAAAKTGTTTDFRDNWTIGFTRYLVAGVWTGNSSGKPMNGPSGAAGAAPLWNSFMEAVIADDSLRQLIGAPEDPDLWEFPVPADVQQLPDCPPSIRCRTDGEFFTDSWLRKTEGNGPLAGTVITRKTLPSHVTRSGASYWPAYCTLDDRTVVGGVGRLAKSPEERSLLRLSSRVGLVFPPDFSTAGRPIPPLADAEPETPGADISLPAAHEIVYYPDGELEKFRLLAWSLRSGIPVSLGPCDDINYYSVRSGDSWTALARSFGLPVADLRAANPQAIRESGYLLQGERLLLPRGITIQRHRESLFHEVQPGESWAYIAETYNIPLRLLLTANPDEVRAFYVLRPGDVLHIPDQVDIYENPFE